MNPARIITYAGFTGTIREWAAHSGLNYNTLSSRLGRGMPIAKALKMPAQPPKHLTLPKIIEYGGERATAAQWAKRIGISVVGLRHRFYRGRTLEEALTDSPHKMPARLRQQVEIRASSKLQCFCCGCPLSVWKSGYYSSFIGVMVPVCGAPGCASADAVCLPRAPSAVVRHGGKGAIPSVSER